MMKIQPFREFRDIYDESGITTIYTEYIKKMVMSIIAIFSVTIIISSIIYGLYYKLSFIKIILIDFSISLISTNIMAFIYLIYPLYMRNQIRKKIDHSLIYSVSYMKIVASSGSSIVTIMEHLANVEDNPEIKKLSNKFVSNVELMGLDVSTALDDVSNRTPSRTLKKLIEGINHNIKTSGNLVSLFNYEIERMFQRKREELKSLMQSLTYLGELYVALMVIGPILFILMIVILSIFLGAGSSTPIRLNLIVFFGMPILASMFLVLLDTMLEGDE